jgi:hypothetical protein
MESIKKRILVKHFIMIGGFFCIVLALFHFFLLPRAGHWELHIQKIPTELAGTIYTLNNALGFIFLGFGILSIMLGKSFEQGSFDAWNFAFLIGAVLLYRAIAQFIHYSISRQDMVMFLICLAISFLYLIPLLIFYKEFMRHKES